MYIENLWSLEFQMNGHEKGLCSNMVIMYLLMFSPFILYAFIIVLLCFVFFITKLFVFLVINGLICFLILRGHFGLYYGNLADTINKAKCFGCAFFGMMCNEWLSFQLSMFNDPLGTFKSETVMLKTVHSYVRLSVTMEQSLFSKLAGG